MLAFGEHPLRLRTHDQRRRRLSRLVFLLYVLLLAEGPLRKWVFPGASNALVFLRDPVMLLILATIGGLARRR
jgi:hypothetical protein